MIRVTGLSPVLIGKAKVHILHGYNDPVVYAILHFRTTSALLVLEDFFRSIGPRRV